MRLLWVELNRLRSRRAVALTVLVAVALSALLVGSALYDTRSVSDADLARAQQQADLEANQGYVVRELKRCEGDPERYLGPDASASDCEASIVPQAEWYLNRSVLDLDREVEERGMALLFLLLGVATIIGTTFAGADWSSGSISNQVLFEPRRAKVWLAKAVAVVLGVAVVSAVVLAAFWASLAAAASLRDLPVPSSAVTDILQTSGRGVALAGAAALGGFALTMLFRSTVGTLGLLLAYAVAGEALTASLPITRMSQWALSANLQAWLSDGTEIYDDSLCQDVGDAGSCVSTYVLTLGHAAGYLGALLALAVVVSFVAFRRRDIP